MAAWRDTYAGLLRAETIERFVDAAYSPASLRNRIERRIVLVASAPTDGTIVAFADLVTEDDRITLAAIYALPEVRGRGAGTALLDEAAAGNPYLPIVADVLVGNRKGEAFYEHRGFEAREAIEADLFGEQALERRWWRTPGRVPGEG